MGLCGVAEPEVLLNRVSVTSTYSFNFDISRRFKVRDDSLSATLGNPNALGDVSYPSLRFLGKIDQDMAMVREEGPLGLSHEGILSQYTKLNTRNKFHV